MTSWKFYDDNADRLFSDYISLSFNSIFYDVKEYFPESIETILDVGAGSGRDSAALAEKGYRIVAVEPSEKMRNLASTFYTSDKITWIDDSLPLLSTVKKIKVKFDLILVSAVWMHLSETEQNESLETLCELLSHNGKIIITLRLGPPEPDRCIKSVSTQYLLNTASILGLNADYISPVNEDSFNRPLIKWQKIVLSKPI
ncbi:class I SAM-dependent methyltransferase [Citrobacter braakii]|uniref:class I SAM-dependent methyltransferase n=1 Tax=Citrobacter braakii TaxID=57706 RepID=UPI0019048FC5|nr:class I SAM-dependent methyltransferase [Citrobacter braakii]MBJ8846559.1 class I SAM-dependent methyltransferase [Citrobacter braakii]